MESQEVRAGQELIFMKPLVSMPESKFLRVACKKCKNEQIIFSKAASEVKCSKCGESMANPGAGNAHIKGKILGVLG